MGLKIRNSHKTHNYGLYQVHILNLKFPVTFEEKMEEEQLFFTVKKGKKFIPPLQIDLAN